MSIKYRETITTILITLVVYLLADFFLGSWLLSAFGPKRDQFRTLHPVYHHTLRPNFQGVGHWGDWTYPVCTDGSGFKSPCNKIGVVDKTFDIAFIGDSFTEGVGVPYEHSFVGIFAQNNPQLKIANLGVVSYSTSIYFSKLRYLLQNGYQFKKLVVFIDIADIYDEAHEYDLMTDGVVINKRETYPFSPLKKIRRALSQYLPLSSLGYTYARQLRDLPVIRSNIKQGEHIISVQDKAHEVALKNTENRLVDQDIKSNEISSQVLSVNIPPKFENNIYNGIYERSYPKSEWSYNFDSTHFGTKGVRGILLDMRAQLLALVDIAKQHGIEVSIAVYPWPGQIKYDIENSLHVQYWQQFSIDNHLKFIDLFPIFLNEIKKTNADKVIENYYMVGDVHFNAAGNRLVADAILKAGIH